MNKLRYLTKNFSLLLVIFFLVDKFSFFNVDSSSNAIRLSDKRHAFDWDSLLNEEETELKRILAAYQRSSDRFEDFEDFYPLDRHTRKPKKQKFIDENENEENSLTNLLQNSEPSSTSADSNLVQTEKPIERAERLESNLLPKSDENRPKRSNALFLTIVVFCSVVGLVGIFASAIFWYKIKKRAEQAEDSEYPSFAKSNSFHGGQRISPSSTMSDRKLAQSAQMFHYQQQRQQMIAREKASLESSPADSDDSDVESNGNGDHTVYECPGLAPTGEMEVRNPLYNETDLTSGERNFQTKTTNEFFPETKNLSDESEKFFS